MSSTGSDAQAPADGTNAPEAGAPDAPVGRSLRAIANDLWRPRPGARPPRQNVDSATAKKIVNGLDRRELTFAFMTVAFDLFFVLADHSALLHSTSKVSRADAPDFLIAGLIATGLVALGIGVRRRALLGFSMFLVGLVFLTYGLFVGFLYNAVMGAWLLFRVSQLQKRRTEERRSKGRSTPSSRTTARTPPAPGRPKASKRYTPPKRRPKSIRP